MLEIKTNSIKFNYINYFNKLVLNKNLINNFCSEKKKYSIKFLHKKKISKIVTLRAPKHFKVGRHHYSLITTSCFLLFNDFKNVVFIKKNKLYNYINFFKKI